MIRILILMASITTLASCAQYREPQANCFTFLASTATAEPDCTFAPLGTSESDIEV